jgi:hypothetical protein
MRYYVRIREDHASNIFEKYIRRMAVSDSLSKLKLVRFTILNDKLHWVISSSANSRFIFTIFNLITSTLTKDGSSFIR